MSKQRTERIHCNKCTHETFHRLLKTVRVDGSFELDAQVMNWHSDYDLIQCCGCDDVRLRETYEDPSGEVGVFFYPPTITRHPPRWRPSIPFNIQSMIREVYRALGANCERLALIGARTVVDMVMLKEVGDAGSFKDKLKALEQKGVLSQKSSQVLDAALDAGSAAAHRGFNPKLDDVHGVLDIVENLLESLYVLDKLAERIRKATPPRKRQTTP